MRPFLVFRLAMFVGAFGVWVLLFPALLINPDRVRPVMMVAGLVWFWAIFGVKAFAQAVFSRWEEDEVPERVEVVFEPALNPELELAS